MRHILQFLLLLFIPLCFSIIGLNAQQNGFEGDGLEVGPDVPSTTNSTTTLPPSTPYDDYDGHEEVVDEEDGDTPVALRAAWKREVMCVLDNIGCPDLNRHTYTHCKRAGGKYFKWKTGPNSPCCRFTSKSKWEKFIDSCHEDDSSWSTNDAKVYNCFRYHDDGEAC